MTRIKGQFSSIVSDCDHGHMVGDGYCDNETNTIECMYDGGDCCGSCINMEHCLECACLGNVSSYGNSNAFIGNGVCNDETNTVNCSLDGFDCCGTNVTSDTCTECACHGEYFLLLLEIGFAIDISL